MTDSPSKKMTGEINKKTDDVMPRRRSRSKGRKRRKSQKNRCRGRRYRGSYYEKRLEALHQLRNLIMSANLNDACVLGQVREIMRLQYLPNYFETIQQAIQVVDEAIREASCQNYWQNV